jgi:rhamnogalacturonyl hydrolase YesR/phosphodiesterase/alkaline phosphatase D-like protein
MRLPVIVLLLAALISTQAQEVHLAQGTMVGEVDTTSAILHARLTATPDQVGLDVPGIRGQGRFEYSTKQNFENSKSSPLLRSSAHYDHILKFKIQDLNPATRYYYRLIYGRDQKNTATSPTATFRTLEGKDGNGEVSFVVVTGMNYMSFHHGIPRKGKRSGERAYTGPDKPLGYPALATMLRMKPDFFVGTGDNVYYDSHDDQEATDAKGIRQKWHQQFVQKRFVDLFRQTATYWEKDDHDHRYNDCDREGNRPPLSDLGIQLFREQVPVVDPTDPDAKTYRSFRINKHLQIWLVEGRDYRSPNKMADGPDKTLWGTEQIAWLKRTLKASDATYKLLISPTPMVGPDDAYKTDNHTNHKGFRTEGRAFFKWIEQQGLDKRGFHTICGDRHWQYHSVDPTGIEEFSSGALVDANARRGRNPGDPKSTDPNREIRQLHSQSEASGGFLRVAIDREATAKFEFYDENGEILYRAIKQQRPTKTAIGVTRDGKPIEALVNEEDFDPNTEKFRLLLVGGLDGKKESNQLVEKLIINYTYDPELKKRLLVSAVAIPTDIQPSPGKFPPPAKAYNDSRQDTAQYLWRWTGMHAPDLVIDLRKGDTLQWHLPTIAHPILDQLRKSIPATKSLTSKSEFATALANNSAANVGLIPALKLVANEPADLSLLLAQIANLPNLKKSPARKELVRRTRRTPVEIVTELSKHYGQSLNSVAYIPSLALVSRLRLGDLTKDPSQLKAVEKIVTPYAKQTRSTFGKRVSGSTTSGHLIFSELAHATKDARYTKLVVSAAKQGFDDHGKPLTAMPYHSEMSDAVFMSCPILAEAGALTGDRKYFDMCLKHLRFMRELCVRKDGIYRHSPLAEAAWGRGNGFPALGLAWTLSALPDDYSGKAEILKAYQEHLHALLNHQDPNGAWHQVIDHPESYRELTSTCMITFAMIRGVRNGWLPADKFSPAIEKAWRAIKTRVGSGGHLVDVCTGTGKQKNLRAYHDRTAILGRDDRGGAMVMMVGTELARGLK